MTTFLNRRTIGLFIIGSIVLLISCRHVVLIPSDTAEYLAHNPVRPPLFPLFLDICRLFFRSHFLRAAVTAQAFLAVASALFLARSFARFRPGFLGEALFFFILLTPQLEHAAVIGSESITYDCYLLLLAFLIEAIHQPTVSRLIAVAACAALAIESRAQFMFVIPVLASGLVLVFLSGARRIVLIMVLVTAVGVVGLGLFNKTYNYVFSHRFNNVPITGIQLLAANLYVSQPEDLAAFRDAPNEKLIAGMFSEAERQHLPLRYKAFGVPTRIHYYDGYAKLCFDVIIGVWTEQRTGRMFDRDAQFRSLTADELMALDRETVSLAFKLWHRTYRRYFVNVVKCWWLDAGLFGVLALLVFPVAALSWFRSRDPLWGVLGFVIALWAANDLLICLFNIIHPRYTFYTDTTLLAVSVGAIISRAPRTTPTSSSA